MDLKVTGFPRCGNTFFLAALRLALPDTVDVVELRKGLPSLEKSPDVIILRDPVAAVISHAHVKLNDVAAPGADDIERTVQGSIDMMTLYLSRVLASNEDSIVVRLESFEGSDEHLNKVLRTIGRLMPELPDPKEITSNEVADQVRIYDGHRLRYAEAYEGHLPDRDKGLDYGKIESYVSTKVDSAPIKHMINLYQQIAQRAATI